MNVNQSHITAENLTYKKFTEVAKDEKIAAFGCSIMISQLVNEQFVNSATEMRYADKKGAEAVLCTPTQGRMPEKYDEIALSTITLDILDLPRKVGTKVKLQYTLGGKKGVADVCPQRILERRPSFHRSKCVGVQGILPG